MKDRKISKALTDVWEWKERAWDSVSHLPTLKEKLEFIRSSTSGIIAEIRDAQRKNNVVFGK